MKRTELKRGGSLKRTKLKQKGRKYAERRKRDFGEKGLHMKWRPCEVCGTTPCDPHHDPPRSLGGTSVNLTSLCRRHHVVRHAIGPTRFLERYGIDLVALAVRIESEWQEAQ